MTSIMSALSAIIQVASGGGITCWTPSLVPRRPREDENGAWRRKQRRYNKTEYNLINNKEDRAGSGLRMNPPGFGRER